MATYFAQANFKTAYLQREIPLDVKVSSGTLKLNVGDVVSISDAGVVTARSNSVEATAKAAVVAGDYIVAQSDMTMGYGHVPVENRNYKYSKEVNLSTTATKVAFFKIINKDDINITSRSV